MVSWNTTLVSAAQLPNVASSEYPAEWPMAASADPSAVRNDVMALLAKSPEMAVTPAGSTTSP